MISEKKRDKRLIELLKTHNSCAASISSKCFFCEKDKKEGGKFKAINGYVACIECVTRCKELEKEI